MPIPMLDSTDPVVLRDQFEAWMQGALARLQGFRLSDNPHPERSRKGDAWENGFEVVDFNLKGILADYEAANADVRRLVRQLDVELHGEAGAAKQASLCDLVGAVRKFREKYEPPKPVPINIVEVIHHKNAYGTQVSVIVDRMPVYRYVREGNLFLAEDDGWFAALEYQPRSSGAFGGRKFPIEMADGTTVECAGQHWHCMHPRRGQASSVGVATMELLEKCYVFMSGCVLQSKLDEWLSKNTPSTDYWKYDSRRRAK